MSDLLSVDVKSGDKLYIAYVIVPELNVHESGYSVCWGGIFVVLHALDERRRAVTYPDNCDADFTHRACLLVRYFQRCCLGFLRDGPHLASSRPSALGAWCQRVEKVVFPVLRKR